VPRQGEAPVTVSGSWAAAPLEGATYQVRGFYDYDGNFDPSFSISRLPTKGDIGGGAIDNAAEVLVGKAPVYRRVALGELASDGTTRFIPETGAHIGGIAVTLALPLPLDTPVFYTKDVLDDTPTKNTDPLLVKMPADFQLKTFSVLDPPGTEKSFIRMSLGAGVPMPEAAAAEKSPFGLPIKTATFIYSRQDVNGDGITDGKDHIPDSAQIPSLFPLSFFTKLNEPSAEQKALAKNKESGIEVLTNQGYPVIVMQGLTLYKSLLNTALFPANVEPQPEMLVALRPAALCIDPTNATKPAVLVVSRETDSKGNKILADEASVTAALSAQFARPVSIKYGCLPQGSYALNLIYGTGQAWTVPNEAGVCIGRELEKDPTTCCAQQGDANQAQTTCSDSAPTRPRLDSQRGVLIVTPPDDPAYCVAPNARRLRVHPDPAAPLTVHGASSRALAPRYTTQCTTALTSAARPSAPLALLTFAKNTVRSASVSVSVARRRAAASSRVARCAPSTALARSKAAWSSARTARSISSAVSSA
jgi:hypothetical protein